jgi:hypothetical protein
MKIKMLVFLMTISLRFYLVADTFPTNSVPSTNMGLKYSAKIIEPNTNKNYTITKVVPNTNIVYQSKILKPDDKIPGK